jgi:hypothetical protein
MMNLATFGPFVVSARAVPKGGLWEGLFTVRKYDGTFTTSSCIVAETPSVLAYATQQDALEAAFHEGRAAAFGHVRPALERIGSITRPTASGLAMPRETTQPVAE